MDPEELPHNSGQDTHLTVSTAIDRELSPSNSSNSSSLNTDEYDMLLETFRIHREMIHEMKQRHRESVHRVDKALIRRGDRKLQLIQAALHSTDGTLTISPRMIKALSSSSPSPCSSPSSTPRLQLGMDPHAEELVWRRESSLKRMNQLEDDAFNLTRVPSPEYFDSFEIDLRLMDDLSFEDYFFDCMPIPESESEDDTKVESSMQRQQQPHDDDIPLPPSMDDEEQMLLDRYATPGGSSEDDDSAAKSSQYSDDSAVMSLADLQPYELHGHSHSTDHDQGIISERESERITPKSPIKHNAVTSEEEQQQIEDILDNLFDTLESLDGSENTDGNGAEEYDKWEHDGGAMQSEKNSSASESYNRFESYSSKLISDGSTEDVKVSAVAAPATNDSSEAREEEQDVLDYFLATMDSMDEESTSDSKTKAVAVTEPAQQDENDISPPSVASSASSQTSALEQASHASSSNSSSQESSCNEALSNDSGEDPSLDDRISLCSPEEDLVSDTSNEEDDKEHGVASCVNKRHSSGSEDLTHDSKEEANVDDRFSISSQQNHLVSDAGSEHDDTENASESTKSQNDISTGEEAQISPSNVIRRAAYIDAIVLEEHQFDEILEGFLDMMDGSSGSKENDADLDLNINEVSIHDTNEYSNQGPEQDLHSPSSNVQDDVEEKPTSTCELDEDHSTSIESTGKEHSECRAEPIRNKAMSNDEISTKSPAFEQKSFVHPIPVSPSYAFSAIRPPPVVSFNAPASPVTLGGQQSVFESSVAHSEQKTEASAREQTVPAQNVKPQLNLQQEGSLSPTRNEVYAFFSVLHESRSRITSPDLNILEESAASLSDSERPHDPVASVLSHDSQESEKEEIVAMDYAIGGDNTEGSKEVEKFEAAENVLNRSDESKEEDNGMSSLPLPDYTMETAAVALKSEPSDRGQASQSPQRTRWQTEVLGAAPFTQSPALTVPSFDQQTVSTMSPSPVHHEGKNEDPLTTDIPGIELPSLGAGMPSKLKPVEPEIYSPPRPIISSRREDAKEDLSLPPKASTTPVQFDSKIPFSRTSERKDRHKQHHTPRTPHRIPTSRSPFRGETVADNKSIFSSPDRSSLRSLRGYYSLASPPRKSAISPTMSPEMSRTPRDQASSPPLSNRIVPSPAMAATPKSPYHHPVKLCTNKFVYNLHPKMGPCDRCWALASSEEQQRFLVRGSHLRIVRTRGGCAATCSIFPPGSNENDLEHGGNGNTPVRLCRQCFFATHQRDGSRLQVYRGNHIKVKLNT